MEQARPSFIPTIRSVAGSNRSRAPIESELADSLAPLEARSAFQLGRAIPPIGNSSPPVALAKDRLPQPRRNTCSIHDFESLLYSARLPAFGGNLFYPHI